MRIESLLQDTYDTGNATIEPWEHLGHYGWARNAKHPELAALLLAKEANALFDCQFLSRDELDFANFIINKLNCDPHFVPSMTLLTAIRSVNAKLRIGRVA